MSWWEETEARAHRAKTPAGMAQGLWQRLQVAKVDLDLAFVPAYDLAHLHDLCADFVKLVDAMLESADGDAGALKRHGYVIARWARHAQAWTQSSAGPFNQLVDSLDLDADLLAQREEVEPGAAAGRPEEESKLDGRYRYYHLLFERLDLKLASIGLEERVHRGLARCLARIYEQALLTVRLISGLERDATPRFRAVARLLLEINTTWHFDLGPYHLGHGELRLRGVAATGLQTWLLLAFAS